MNPIFAAVIGLVIALPLNVLAQWLPTFSPTYRERKAAAEESARSYGPSKRALQVRYVLVVLVIIVAAVYLWGWADGTLKFAMTLGYVAIFVLIIVIDVEYLIVPDVLIIPAFVYALIELIITQRLPFQSALAGFAAAQILITMIYLGARLYMGILNRGRSEDSKITVVPFGFGDITLATLCGLIVGFVNVPFLIILMMLLGAVTAVISLFGRILTRRSMSAFMVIPYGPSIVLSALALLIWQRSVITTIFGSS